MNPIGPLFFLYLAVMAWLFERRTQWFSRFGVFTSLIGALLIRYGVAVPFSDGVNPAVTHIAISSSQLVEFYVSVVLAYAGIYAGVVLTDVSWRDRFVKGCRLRPSIRSLVAVAAVTFGIVVVAWVVLPWQDFANGIYSILPGHTAAAYRQHRIQYGADTSYSTSSFSYLGSFIRFAIAPAVLWVLFFYRRKSRIIPVLFAILFATLFLIGLLSGQKLPELLLLLGLVVAILVDRGLPSVVNWRLLVVVAVLVIAIAPALYHVQYPGLDYASLVQLTVYRLTEEYSRVAQLRFVFYPDLHPYLFGLSSFVVRGAAHLVRIDTSWAQSPEVYIPAHAPGVGPNYGGTWNAGFFADAWADFGFAGVVAASVLVGAVVRAIDRWFIVSGRGPVEKGVYTAVCISALYVSEVATLTSFWTYGLVSVFLVYGIFFLLSLRNAPMNHRVGAMAEGTTH
jgi:hypothetical protein